MYAIRSYYAVSSQKTISANDILRTEIIVNQALIDILIDKQIISEEELVAYIKKIMRQQQNTLAESRKIVSLKK